MNKTCVRFASRWLVLPALVALAAPPAMAGNHAAPRIRGVWTAHVDITNCLPGNVPGPVTFASFDAVNVFTADGTFLDTNSTNPALQSAHFGYWKHIRGNKYQFAQKFFLFEPGIPLATKYRIVRHDVVLDRTGLSFTSGGSAETYNMDGVLLETGCSKSSAVRFD